MADQVQANNKLVRFRKRLEKEYVRMRKSSKKGKKAKSAIPRHMLGKGLISEKAMAAMAEMKGGKKAKKEKDTRPPEARNQPKPAYAESSQRLQSMMNLDRSASGGLSDVQRAVTQDISKQFRGGR